MKKSFHHSHHIYVPGLFILFILMTIAVAPAQEGLTLQDCLRLSLEKSRLVKVSELSIRQAGEKIGESQAQRLPLLSLGGTYTHIGKVTSFTIPMGPTRQTFRFGTPDRFNFDAKMQMQLFTWGRIASTIRMSYLGEKLSRVDRRKEISNVIYQTIQAYYSVLLNEKIIQLHQENLNRADELHRISQTRYESGGLPRLELLRSEVQVKNTASTLQESQGNLEKSKLLLIKLTRLPGENLSVKGHLQFIPVETDPQQVIERALTVRSDINAIRLQQNLSEQEIKVAVSNNKPSLALFSGYNVQNGFDPTDPQRFVDNWNVGVQLSFPLFDGFATRHKVQNARLALQKTALQKEEIKELIILQIRQAFTTLDQAALRINSQQENIQLSRETLQTAMDQFEQGIASSLDVLTAQQTLAQNEMIYTQALFNHIMARLEISRTMEDYSWFAPDLSSEQIEQPFKN
jgi:outer membrane protein